MQYFRIPHILKFDKTTNINFESNQTLQAQRIDVGQPLA